MTVAIDLVGQVLDEKYLIEKRLGQGGMGAVYLARHLGTERPVALKVIMPQFTANVEFIERFRREAKAAGLLRHPNVVNVTDFGFATLDRDRIAYLVMEYLTGGTLGDIIKERGRLPLEFTVDIVEQVCLAIGEAHRQGIIHRDLKPDNIWLEPNGRGGYNVKVLDFGLAKLRQDAQTDLGVEQFPAQNRQTLPIKETDTFSDATDVSTRIQNVEITDGEETQPLKEYVTGEGQRTPANRAGALTQAGDVLGTPLYMSPEQCVGRGIDLHSDIYSLGVIVYQMLAGETPFKGNAYSLIKQHVDTVPPALKEKRPDIPDSVSELLMSSLSKNPASRPLSAAAFAGALRARTEGAGTVLRRAIAIYSEYLSTFIRISLFANIPMITIGILLLLLIPTIEIGFREFVIFFILILNSLMFTFTVNRFGFTIVLEQLIVAPLGRIDFQTVIEVLSKRLGITDLPTGPSKYLKIYYKIVKIGLKLSPSLAQINCPSVMIVEGLGRREAILRSKELVSRLPHVLKGITRFALLLYMVPTTLFFFSAFGIARIIEMDMTSSINVSVTVATIVMGLNVVWIIPPAHIALVMLYFKSRQAGGEAPSDSI
jgi:serine/threonine protein kinase